MQTLTADPSFEARAPRAAEPVTHPAQTVSKQRVWTGRVLSGLALLFLALDCTLKLLSLAPAIQGTTELGYPVHSVLTIGLIQLVCIALYAVPHTAPLGAILLTGYFGGAVATHLRVESPLFSHVLFPLYFAALVWGGLYLRDPRLSLLLPFSREQKV